MDIGMMAKMMAKNLVRDSVVRRNRSWYADTASEYGSVFLEQHVFKTTRDVDKFVLAFIREIPDELIEED